MNHDHLTTADARWQRLADADLCGEPLTAADREFLATHVSSDPTVRAEQQLRLALARPLDLDPIDATADERLISALVDRHLAAPPITPSARPRPALWLAAGLLLAAGLAFVWLRPPPATPTPATPRPDPIALLSGPADLGELAAVPGDSLPTDRELTTHELPACVGAPGRIKACLAPHSRARLGDDGALELLEGAATVEVSAALPVTQFILQVAGVRITSPDGDFAVSVRTRTWTAAATRGHAEIHDPTGLLARLGPGDRLTRGDAPPLPTDPQLAATRPVPSDIPATAAAPVLTDSPPVPEDSPPVAAPPVPEDSPVPANKPASKPSPPAAELLAQAREHRAAGRVRDALRAYQRLVAAHPDSPLAGTAQLAIGQLYLGPASDPAAALRAFDAYLVHPGPLAEEAAHGRISALLRLGRHTDATAAIDRFLARYPASSYADALRRQSAP